MSDEVKVLHEWSVSPAGAARQRLVRGDGGPVYYEWCLGVPGHEWKRVDAPPAEVFMDAVVSLASLLATRTRELEEARRALLEIDEWGEPDCEPGKEEPQHKRCRFINEQVAAARAAQRTDEGKEE